MKHSRLRATRGHIVRTIGPVLVCILSLTMSSVVFSQSKSPTAATVNGKPITKADVDNSIVAQILPLEEQIYALRKVALENLVVRTLLEQEAKRKGISAEDLKKQFTAGPINIPSGEVDREYLQNAAAFGAMSPDEAKERIRLSLESQERMKLYIDAVAELRKKAQVDIQLEEPRLPEITNDGSSPSIGPAEASITLIEFSDFQCPFCRESRVIVQKVLENYGQNVRLVFKHLPLDMHERAFEASRAAFCAGEQRLFWRYHDLLFASQDLSAATLTKIASSSGLDIAKFSTCLKSDASRDAVLRDLEEAKRFGINSTPTFIINGRLVRGTIAFDDFKSIINRELLRKQQRPGNTQ